MYQSIQNNCLRHVSIVTVLIVIKILKNIFLLCCLNKADSSFNDALIYGTIILYSIRGLSDEKVD